MNNFNDLELVLYPDDRLRIKCENVDKFTKELPILVNKMLEIMHKENGIGLAAPQVGLQKNIIVLDTLTASLADKSYTPFYGAMINPNITFKSKKKETEMEGCLSFKQLRIKKERPHMIAVTWQDLEGNFKLGTFSGITARCIIHEHEHTLGILFTDSDISQKASSEESR